jgi:hypothetical protein
MDLPPTLSAFSALTSKPNTVELSAQARDDKGLREIAYVIYNANGAAVITDRASIPEYRDFSGTFASITLDPGGYSVTAQAVDLSGKVSGSMSQTFRIFAEPVYVVVKVDPPAAAAQAKFSIDRGPWISLEAVLRGGTTEYQKRYPVEPNVQHRIEFSPVTGFKTADPKDFTIQGGTMDDNSITGYYFRNPSGLRIVN